MVKLLDIIDKTLFEADGEKPTIKVGGSDIDTGTSENLHDIKNAYLRRQGFIPVAEPHPAVRKLLTMYRKYNPTVYQLLQPSNCTYCKSTTIKTACVFFDEIEKKFCLAYNPQFVNQQIDGFEELIKDGKAKNWADNSVDEDDLSYESLRKLNFLIAHEIDHILKGDLTRFGKIVGIENPSKETHKIHNIAADAVNNQELLDTNFKLGGTVGYNFIKGGMLSKRNLELFKKYNIDPEKAVIISEISKKNPYDMEENSDTYFKWMLAHLDEYDKYMEEKGNKDDDEEEDGDGGDGGGDDDSEVIYRVGDPIYIPELGKYGKVTAVRGEDVDFDTISEEEARALAPVKARLGFAMASNPTINAGPFEIALCTNLRITRLANGYREGLVERIFNVSVNLLNIRGVK